MKQFISTLIINLFFVGSVLTQTNVFATLDKTDILIGDQLELGIFIELEDGAVLESIDQIVIENVEAIEILQQKKLEKPENNEYILQRFVLTSFDSGYHKIPPIPIIYNLNGQTKTIKTNDLAFTVKIIPITDDATPLAPIKNIVEEPLNFFDILPYLLIGIGIIGLAVGVYFYFKTRKKQINVPPPVIIPAHEIALKKLKALQSAKLWQQGKIKQFQSELTYIVREYLEKRYEIPALESTTEETLQMVRGLDVKEEWNDKLKDMFQIADLVKFAKAKPPADFHDQILIDAEHFVFETKKKPVDPESIEPT